jgi:hypothetical protein
VIDAGNGVDDQGVYVCDARFKKLNMRIMINSDVDGLGGVMRI